MEKAQYEVGDVVRMKKPHPCGSKEWKITRTGMDFGWKCRGWDKRKRLTSQHQMAIILLVN